MSAFSKSPSGTVGPFAFEPNSDDDAAVDEFSRFLDPIGGDSDSDAETVVPARNQLAESGVESEFYLYSEGWEQREYPWSRFSSPEKNAQPVPADGGQCGAPDRGRATGGLSGLDGAFRGLHFQDAIHTDLGLDTAFGSLGLSDAERGFPRVCDVIARFIVPGIDSVLECAFFDFPVRASTREAAVRECQRRINAECDRTDPFLTLPLVHNTSTPVPAPRNQCDNHATLSVGSTRAHFPTASAALAAVHWIECGARDAQPQEILSANALIAGKILALVPGRSRALHVWDREVSEAPPHRRGCPLFMVGDASLQSVCRAAVESGMQSNPFFSGAEANLQLCRTCLRPFWFWPFDGPGTLTAGGRNVTLCALDGCSLLGDLEFIMPHATRGASEEDWMRPIAVPIKGRRTEAATPVSVSRLLATSLGFLDPSFYPEELTRLYHEAGLPAPLFEPDVDAVPLDALPFDLGAEARALMGVAGDKIRDEERHKVAAAHSMELLQTGALRKLAKGLVSPNFGKDAVHGVSDTKALDWLEGELLFRVGECVNAIRGTAPHPEFEQEPEAMGWAAKGMIDDDSKGDILEHERDAVYVVVLDILGADSEVSKQITEAGNPVRALADLQHQALSRDFGTRCPKRSLRRRAFALVTERVLCGFACRAFVSESLEEPIGGQAAAVCMRQAACLASANGFLDHPPGSIVGAHHVPDALRPSSPQLGWLRPYLEVLCDRAERVTHEWVHGV